MIVTIRRYQAPRGVSATLRTVELIRKAILEGSQDWRVRQRALGIVRHARVPAKDHLGEICALFDYCARKLRYTRDPVTAELVHGAVTLLGLIDAMGSTGGDCDDQVVLLGSLAASIGFPIAIRIVGPKPGEFRHVHLRVRVGRQWLPADLTAWPKKPLGWEPRAAAERVFLLSGQEVTGMPYIGTLEGMGGKLALMDEKAIAQHVGSLGYPAYEITEDGEVIGVRETLEGLGFWDVVGDVVGGAVDVASKAGEALSAAAPVVSLLDPAAGASMAAAGSVTSAVSEIAKGGGKPKPKAKPPAKKAPKKPPPKPKAARPAPRPAPPPPRALRPAPPAPPPKPAGLFSNPMLLLAGGGALVLGVGIYLATRKKAA